MKRAIRRRHYRRLIKRWERIYKDEWGVNDPKVIELNVPVHARTRKPCSCWMCGNPRKYLNEITKQEKIANDILNYEKGYCHELRSVS